MENHRICSRNPMLRIALEHQLNTKFHRDKLFENYDTEEWYSCDLEQLPDDVKALFLHCHLDEETSSFLDLSYEKSEWLFTQMWHSLVKSISSWFACPTTINGWLGRGSMFVFSEKQFLSLIGEKENFKATHLLDLGAGDGEVTKKMAKFFSHTSATEMSWTMRSRLMEKGYKVLSVTEWTDDCCQYDVISCLNLLDRCECPLQILKDIKSHIKPTGLAIVALVLPYKPFIEFGSKQNKPKEVLGIQGKTWEEQVASFIRDVIPTVGFTVTRFTRLPYLCEGDANDPFYYLIDAVFVLKPDG